MGLSKEQSAKKKKSKKLANNYQKHFTQDTRYFISAYAVKTEAISILLIDHGYSNTSAINGVSNFSTMLQRTKEASSAH